MEALDAVLRPNSLAGRRVAGPRKAFLLHMLKDAQSNAELKSFGLVALATQIVLLLLPHLLGKNHPLSCSSLRRFPPPVCRGP
ncbi:hypothetical protein ILYODFUR_037224 [Ilyodon furcidens]|uniref:Uncharacterized protein n=1 Tax=Ilyodon furcidens TaxID=33524 RepID=A0ABV0TQ14_9TELE